MFIFDDVLLVVMLGRNDSGGGCIMEGIVVRLEYFLGIFVVEVVLMKFLILFWKLSVFLDCCSCGFCCFWLLCIWFII